MKKCSNIIVVNRDKKGKMGIKIRINEKNHENIKKNSPVEMVISSFQFNS